MIAEAIRRVVARESLSADEMYATFADVMDGNASEAQKGSLLVALRMKGETAEEITGAARAMRERVERLDVSHHNLIDTCGTGGDGQNSFNISTAAAIVAAGAGARVAKHGNRAVSSASGSADVLVALGVRIDLDRHEMTEVLQDVGISFLFAPKLHPAMASVVTVRRELGIRTIFNVLGPLTNPAFARRQVLGVYERGLVPVIAHVLVALGAEHALVVHSDDGMDEIAVSADTNVAEVKRGAVKEFKITPEEIGVRRHGIAELQGGTPEINAGIIRSVLGGIAGATREVVLANAGAALYVSGIAQTMKDGVRIAAESIDSGAALAKLEQLATVTNRFGDAR